MSMYPMLFGENVASGLLLALIGLDKAAVPRYRDCYLEGDKIVVYTRTGGGNRDFYESERSCRSNYPKYFEEGKDDHPSGPWNEDLRAIPGYIGDEDDDFDCTYAYFKYEFPEAFKEIASQIPQSASSGDKWDNLLAKMAHGDKNDPEVAAAIEKARPMMEQLAAAISCGENGAVIEV